MVALQNQKYADLLDELREEVNARLVYEPGGHLRPAAETLELGRAGCANRAVVMAHLAHERYGFSPYFVITRNPADHAEGHVCLYFAAEDPEHYYLSGERSEMWPIVKVLCYASMMALVASCRFLPPDDPITEVVVLRDTDPRWLLQHVQSNETARTIASSYGRNLAGKIAGQVNVMSGEIAIENPFIICDGTADEVQINAAIGYVAGQGGGTIHLGPGTFNLAAAMGGAYSNVIIQGVGPETILSKDYNGHAIDFVGSTASHITNITLRDLAITQADANDTSLLYFHYLDGGRIQNVTLLAAGHHAAIADASTDVLMDALRVIDWNKADGGTDSGAAILYLNAATGVIRDCYLDGNLTVHTAQTDGIDTIGSVKVTGNTITRIRGSGEISAVGTAGDECDISGNIISDLSSSAAGQFVAGVYLNSGNRSKVSNNRVSNLKNTGLSTMVHAVWVGSVSQSLVNGNYCSNNGTDTGISNAAGCQFADGGTSTMISQNSWQ